MAKVVTGKDFISGLLGDEDEVPVARKVGAQIEFTIKKWALQILLEKAAVVVAIRESAMPVLKNFQFEVTPNLLRVVATDMELSMIASTEFVTVGKPGTAVFPAQKMLEILRKARDGDAAIKVSGGTASITIGPTAWNLKLQGGADYPSMPDLTEATFVTVDRLKFAAALNGVKYAACKDTTRDSLCMIDVTGGKMTACDGSRFQQARVDEFPFDFQIPIDAVADLLKLLKAVDLDTISVGESVNHLIFKLGTDVFIANKLVAQFPNMEHALLRPAMENKHELTADRDELLEAVSRVRITADDTTSAIALRLTAGKLTVVSKDKYSNDATETIEAGWDGPERTVVVNHAFLTDMVKGYAAKSCRFLLGDDTKTRKTPVMLRDDDAGTVGVVQQMHGDWVGV